LPAMTAPWRFCPCCGHGLESMEMGGRERLACPAAGCGFVHWGNPTPVVAALIERDGAIVLARNQAWPEKVFALVAGFLEAGESPEQGALREVREELGLEGEIAAFIGVYPFHHRNELILAYHVRAHGEITLGEEIAEVRHVPPEKLRAWPFGTGLAVRDWLAARGLGGDRSA
jgi:NAD+ diphosphatase